MDFLMNGLLLAATCFAGGYCWVLARRVHDLKSLDKGLGGAIVTLTRQVELARTTLEEARSSSSDTRLELAQLVQRADSATTRLRLLIAAAPEHAPAAGPAPNPRLSPAPPPATGGAAARDTGPEPDSPARHAPLPASASGGAPANPGGPDDPEASTCPTASLVRLAPRPKAAVPAIVPDRAASDDSAPAPAPIAIPSLDRLVTGPLARPLAADAAGATPPAAPELAEVPKPRTLAPIESPLRRIRAAATKPAPVEAAARPDPGVENSEDAILEALTALAGGR